VTLNLVFLFSSRERPRRRWVNCAKETCSNLKCLKEITLRPLTIQMHDKRKKEDTKLSFYYSTSYIVQVDTYCFCFEPMFLVLSMPIYVVLICFSTYFSVVFLESGFQNKTCLTLFFKFVFILYVPSSAIILFYPCIFH
jgi:hypothetical protein